MKKLLVLLFLGFSLSAQSQIYFNGESESDLGFKTHLVVSINRWFKKCNLQLQDGPSRREYFLSDKNARALNFENYREILDYMYENNWEFVGNLDVIEGYGRELIFKKRLILTPSDKLKE